MIVLGSAFDGTGTPNEICIRLLPLLNLLIHAATTEGGRVTVLFAMRSDFVSNCAMYPQLNALLNQQFIQVGAMQPDELASAIARPALQVGLSVVDCDHLIKAILGCACAVA